MAPYTLQLEKLCYPSRCYIYIRGRKEGRSEERRRQEVAREEGRREDHCIHTLR